MAWMIPAAMAASSLVSGYLGNRSAGDAADAQLEGGRNALMAQRAAAMSGIQQMYPMLQGQTNALNRLYSMQGMPSIQTPSLNSLLAPYQNLGAPPPGSGGGGGGGESRSISDPLGLNEYGLGPSGPTGLIDKIFG